MSRLRTQLNTDLVRPVVSLLHLGAAATLTAPLLAVAARHGCLPAITPPAVAFRYDQAGRLQVRVISPLEPARCDVLPALAERFIAVTVRGLLEPFSAALTATVAVSPLALAGNLLSALAAAARLVQPSDAGARARALVDLIQRGHAPLRDAGRLRWQVPDSPGYFRRRNCCLFYRVPGGGFCGDCILAPNDATGAPPA